MYFSRIVNNSQPAHGNTKRVKGKEDRMKGLPRANPGSWLKVGGVKRQIKTNPNYKAENGQTGTGTVMGEYGAALWSSCVEKIGRAEVSKTVVDKTTPARTKSSVSRFGGESE